MPLHAEELVTKLIEATDEAQQTLRNLHSARRDAQRTAKELRADVDAAVAAAVDAALADLRVETMRRMQLLVAETIDELAADWRKKLGVER